MLLNIFIILLP